MDKRRGQPERMSELQKFIISACYMKTVMKKPLPRKIYGFNWTEEDLTGEYGEYYRARKNLYLSALYESDIMLNYYHMVNPNGETYGYIGGSNSQKTALRRSLKTLQERGYINPSYEQWSIKDENGHSFQSRAIITLTEKGKLTAENLLKVV